MYTYVGIERINTLAEGGDYYSCQHLMHKNFGAKCLHSMLINLLLNDNKVDF